MGEAELDFSSECDAIVRRLSFPTYEESVSLIDALEKRVHAVHAAANPLLSCADLRLDAALMTQQSAQECERRYDELVQCGADPTMRLLKACVLIRESPRITRSMLEKLTGALEQAKSHAPVGLIETAEKLRNAHGH